MASEWVGVVGTALGAGIGIVGLLIGRRFDARDRAESARREDTRRLQDQDWEVKRQNVEQRRDVYGQLLAAALEIDGTVSVLLPLALGTWTVSINDVPVDEGELNAVRHAKWMDVKNAVDRYRAGVAASELVAVDRSVFDRARALLEAAYGVVRWARAQPGGSPRSRMARSKTPRSALGTTCESQRRRSSESYRYSATPVVETLASTSAPPVRHLDVRSRLRKPLD